MLPLVPVVACCALAAVTALCVVALRRPVYVAVSLLGHSLSLAGLYLALGAQLSAAAQTLIYSGAIVVLFLIVVALLPSGGAERVGLGRVVAGVAVFLATAAGLAAAVAASGLPHAKKDTFSVEQVGAPLFDELLVPFELTAPLLLAAIVAAIALWRRQELTRPADVAGDEARP
ncbi:MAG: NADH-quinone oxidoreductase subunit J [Deltaproteobacteria bacterium]|nr:NADH-quinone oxidoreductase subunit J [Deltaproteobacteria bacterium]